MVLPAWWGLNAFFRECCDRLAGEGFFAFAPDLYQGRVVATVEEAKALRSKLNQQAAFAELLKGIDELKSMKGVTGERVGLIGFSMGARFALELSAQKPAVAAVVTFYGASIVDYTSSTAAYLCHFAETDPWLAASGVKRLQKALRSAGRPLEFHTYPGTGHWFFEADRPEVFSPASAELAWQRTIAFLQKQLF